MIKTLKQYLSLGGWLAKCNHDWRIFLKVVPAGWWFGKPPELIDKCEKCGKEQLKQLKAYNQTWN